MLPGCVDPHTHLDMPFGGTVTIDDVESGQTAAAFGGTTCHVDFCIQAQGQSFADALADWHAKAEGKQLIDMGYHIAVTDLSAPGALDELAALPDQGVTSYKLFMAYKGALMVDDETLFRTMEVAARDRRARDGARRERRCDRRARQAGARRRPHRAALARAHPAARDRGRGDQPRDPARAHRRRAALRRPRLLPGGGRADRGRAREGLGRLGRDLHAVLLRRLRRFLERPDFEGAKYVYTPPPRDKANQDVLWDAVAHRRPLGDLDRPLRLQLGRPEDARPRRLLEDPERRPRAREPAADDPPLRRPRGPDRRSTGWSSCSRRTRRSSSASTRARARSRSAPTPTSSIFDPEKRVTISAATHHSRVDYNLYEGTEVVGSPEIVLLRGNVLVEGGELVASPGIGRYVARAQVRRGAAGGQRGPRVASSAGGGPPSVGPAKPSGEARSLPPPLRDRARRPAVSSLLC